MTMVPHVWLQGVMHAQTPQPKCAGNAEARTYKGVKVEPALGIKLQGACPVKSFDPALLFILAFILPVRLNNDSVTW